MILVSESRTVTEDCLAEGWSQ